MIKHYPGDVCMACVDRGDAPVLFLDVDGVLNSHEWRDRAHAEPRERLAPREETHLSPALVSLVNDAVARTGAVCVLSSSWRYNHNVAQMEDRLWRAGGDAISIVDLTPTHLELHGVNFHESYMCESRGREISEWLSLHGAPGGYAVIDDCASLHPHMERAVITDARVGVTARDVEALVRLLAGGA